MLEDDGYEAQEDPSVEETAVLRGHGRISKTTAATPKPYRVVGVDARGRKIRVKADTWNTEREEYRRAFHVRVRRARALASIVAENSELLARLGDE